jgi:hypothetical protein
MNIPELSWTVITKLPQTWGLTNNRYLILTVLQARSLRSWYQHQQVLARAHLLWQIADFSLSKQRREGNSPGTLVKAEIPLVRASQRLHLLIPSHRDTSFQLMNFEEIQTFSPKQSRYCKF